MNLQGINIQWPISELILKGEKIIETRTYPLPKKFVGVPLLFIETPGQKGNFKARGVAIIIFESSKMYKSKEEFRNDYNNHKVEKDSSWDWQDKPKYGWIIQSVKLLKDKVIVPSKRGYVFTSLIELPD